MLALEREDEARADLDALLDEWTRQREPIRAGYAFAVTPGDLCDSCDHE